MRLVTIEQLRMQCRTDEFDDAALRLYAAAAEQHVQDFLNRNVYPDAEAMAEAVLEGAAGCSPIVVNDAIRAAVLLLAGHLYANREATSHQALHEVPLGVSQMLWPHRAQLGF